MPKGENNRRLTDEQRTEIVRRYTTRLPDGTWEGVTTLARDFGVSHNCIQYHLKRAGVQTRSPKEAHSGGKRCKPIKNLPTGDAPACKCGCGAPVSWNQRANQWRAYIDGHYRRDAPYKADGWLRTRYLVELHTTHEMAAECGVAQTTIVHWMDRYGIARRDISAARVGRRVGDRNPAWRGGVADWAYSHDWKRVAREIRMRDKYTCQACGEQRKRWGKHLHVHHIDEDKTNNAPDNLVSLCAACHREAHRYAA